MRFIFFRLPGKVARQGVYNLGKFRRTHPDWLISTGTSARAFFLFGRVVVLRGHISAIYRHLSLVSLIRHLICRRTTFPGESSTFVASSQHSEARAEEVANSSAVWGRVAVWSIQNHRIPNKNEEISANRGTTVNSEHAQRTEA